MKIIKFYFLSIALFMHVTGCASASDTELFHFMKINAKSIEREKKNEIFGTITQVITPYAALKMDEDCLYRFKEIFVNEAGARIDEMSSPSEKDLLLSMEKSDCSTPTEPLIKLVSMDASTYLNVRSSMRNFLAGRYSISSVPGTSAYSLNLSEMQLNTVSMVDKSRLELGFSSPKGFFTAYLDVQNSQMPSLVSVDEWQ